VWDGRNVLRRGKRVERVETVSASAREEVGPPDQHAILDILVGSHVVRGGTESQSERLRRSAVLAVAVRVAAVVVGVPVRHSLLVELDLLDGDVCSRSLRPRRDQLGERYCQRQGVHRRDAPRSTANVTTRRATQPHDCPSSRAMLAITA
jgi:hypothetical protein